MNCIDIGGSILHVQNADKRKLNEFKVNVHDLMIYTFFISGIKINMFTCYFYVFCKAKSH